MTACWIGVARKHQPAACLCIPGTFLAFCFSSLFLASFLGPIAEEVESRLRLCCGICFHPRCHETSKEARVKLLTYYTPCTPSLTPSNPHTHTHTHPCSLSYSVTPPATPVSQTPTLGRLPIMDDEVLAAFRTERAGAEAGRPSVLPPGVPPPNEQQQQQRRQQQAAAAVAARRIHLQQTRRKTRAIDFPKISEPVSVIDARLGRIHPATMVRNNPGISRLLTPISSLIFL